jgi:hypothetical protein
LVPDSESQTRLSRCGQGQSGRPHAATMLYLLGVTRGSREENIGSPLFRLVPAAAPPLGPRCGTSVVPALRTSGTRSRSRRFRVAMLHLTAGCNFARLMSCRSVVEPHHSDNVHLAEEDHWSDAPSTGTYETRLQPDFNIGGANRPLRG